MSEKDLRKLAEECQNRAAKVAKCAVWYLCEVREYCGKARMHYGFDLEEQVKAVPLCVQYKYGEDDVAMEEVHRLSADKEAEALLNEFKSTLEKTEISESFWHAIEEEMLKNAKDNVEKALYNFREGYDKMRKEHADLPLLPTAPRRYPANAQTTSATPAVQPPSPQPQRCPIPDYSPAIGPMRLKLPKGTQGLTTCSICQNKYDLALIRAIPIPQRIGDKKPLSISAQNYAINTVTFCEDCYNAVRYGSTGFVYSVQETDTVSQLQDSVQDDTGDSSA